MQNLLTSAQMRSADAFTIKQKGISSIELMENACTAFTNVFMQEVSEKETSIAVVCGKGNNGADGLAIARLLLESDYLHVSVYLTQFSERETEEYHINLSLLKKSGLVPIVITSAEQLAIIEEEVIIDAVLGSGLNKPLTDNYKDLAIVINNLNRKVIAVDVPTGFPAEGRLDQNNVYLKADLVICFQRPKINFFFPESLAALKRFIVADIGLDEYFIQDQVSAYQLTGISSIRKLIKPREIFSHKGTYGHALIVAGQPETMGAALLSAMACLNSGAGLTTLAIPRSGLTALNTSLPEVMYTDREKLDFNGSLEKFKAIAIGPGLGTGEEGERLVADFLNLQRTLVIDADALNIIAERKDLLASLPRGSVLTPHMKEFDHLFGKHDSWWDRLHTAIEKAKQIGCTIVLKNQYTFVVSPAGNVSINPTGNPAMAQGGMGDILTGIIVSFLAQGYTPDEASIIACYLHGASGDELAKYKASVSASSVASGISALLKGLTR